MAATRIWIKNPLAIFTANTLDAAGGLVIEDGVISELLKAGQQPSQPCNRTFDAREHVVLPGLINTHHHFFQTLTRAHPAAINKELTASYKGNPPAPERAKNDPPKRPGNKLVN